MENLLGERSAVLSPQALATLTTQDGTLAPTQAGHQWVPKGPPTSSSTHTGGQQEEGARLQQGAVTGELTKSEAPPHRV